MNEPTTTDAEQVALILRRVLKRQDQLIELMTRLSHNINNRLRAIEERDRWVDNYRANPTEEHPAM